MCAAGAESFSLRGQVLPCVTVYKYLGVHITNGGGWSANIKAIRSKCAGRTKEVLTWCQARMCPIPLAERLWRVYAEPAIINATAVMQLTDKQITSLDTVQRAAGRAILEFLPRSPTPAVLLELGWAAWSSLHRVEMARLLARVTCSPNDITRALMEQMSNSVDTWAHKAAEDIEPWMSDAQLDIKSEWDTPIQQMKESLIEAHFDQLRIDGQAHHNLDSYVSVWWLKTGQHGYNRTLMNCGLCDRAVKAVGRLMVGGQGLIGGDPAHDNEATQITCCMPCLRCGHKRVESLQHVTFHCLAYASCRRNIARLIHRQPNDIFLLCRDVWKLPEIRQIACFFHEILKVRGGRRPGSRKDRFSMDEPMIAPKVIAFSPLSPPGVVIMSSPLTPPPSQNAHYWNARGAAT